MYLKPKVSILVPIYNVEMYLERCLNSIINQTLTNIEIICVNDGSTDKSEEILEQYQRLDSRIIVVTQTNKGLPAARNTAIKKANGEYLGFVDGDDFINSNMFKRLVEVANKDKADIVICGANIIGETNRNNDWLKTSLKTKRKKYKKFTPNILYKRLDTTPFLWRTLIKQDLIRTNHLELDEDIVLGEDKLFQCKVYPYANRISVIKDQLYNYVDGREGSLTKSLANGNYNIRLDNHCKLINRIACDLRNNPQTNNKDYYKKFLNWCIPFIYYDFIQVEESRRYLIKYQIPEIINILKMEKSSRLLNFTTKKMVSNINKITKYDNARLLREELCKCRYNNLKDLYCALDIVETLLEESIEKKDKDSFIFTLEKFCSFKKLIIKKVKLEYLFNKHQMIKEKNNALILQICRIVNMIHNSDYFDNRINKDYNPQEILFNLIRLRQKKLQRLLK